MKQGPGYGPLSPPSLAEVCTAMYGRAKEAREALVAQEDVSRAEAMDLIPDPSGLAVLDAYLETLERYVAATSPGRVSEEIER